MPTKLVYVYHTQLMSDSVFMKTDIQTDNCVRDKWALCTWELTEHINAYKK